MKKTLFAIVLFAGFGVMQAQDAQKCPCLMDNNIDALYAVAEQQSFSYDLEMMGSITASDAILQVALKVLDNIPESFSYYLKVTAGGEIRYAKVSSCQMALEKTYDLLRLGVEEVRIVAETYLSQVNPSCRNKSYTPRDLDDVKKRRDGILGGRY